MRILLRIATIFVLSLSLFVGYIGSAKAELYIHTLSGEIFPGKLQQFITNLENAKEGDVFTLDIASNGGRLDEAAKAIIAMKETKGTVMCRARTAASAAAFIFMACHYGQVDPDGVLVFHFARSQNLETGIRKYFRNTPKYIDILDVATRLDYENLRQFLISLGVKDLLTSDEWTLLKDGEDIYITGPEFHRRVVK